MDGGRVFMKFEQARKDDRLDRQLYHGAKNVSKNFFIFKIFITNLWYCTLGVNQTPKIMKYVSRSSSLFASHTMMFWYEKDNNLDSRIVTDVLLNYTQQIIT